MATPTTLGFTPDTQGPRERVWSVLKDAHALSLFQDCPYSTPFSLPPSLLPHTEQAGFSKLYTSPQCYLLGCKRRATLKSRLEIGWLGHWLQDPGCQELRPRIKGICPSFHSFTEGNDLNILKLPGIVQVLSGWNCIHAQESRGNPRASLGT